MADSPETRSDRAFKDQFADNPAEVNTTPDLAALKPTRKKRIGRPNEERRAKQLLDRIAAKKKGPKPKACE